MGLSNLTKNQLANLFTNQELRNLIQKDKSKMQKVNSMSKVKNTSSSNNNLPPCYPGGPEPCKNNFSYNPGA